MAGVIEQIRSWFQRHDVAAEPEAVGDGYRVYTREFDVEIDGKRLDDVLGPLSPIATAALDEAWSAFSGALLGWRTKVHLVALEAAARVRTLEPEDALKDTAVAILVDQSGSMRGQSMLLAAAAADVARDFLVHLGAGVEILGFTTVAWKGGRARQKWLRKGRPANPGRLCDLLHIVYDEPRNVTGGTGGWSLRPMLRPDLPKENVDGEAIQWAVGRLRARPQTRKVLLVVSDGAPVDDSTLLSNTPDYLVRHLKSVIADLANDPGLHVAAVGIGFDVDRYYQTAATVETPDDLGVVMIGLLEKALSGWPAS